MSQELQVLPELVHQLFLVVGSNHDGLVQVQVLECAHLPVFGLFPFENRATHPGPFEVISLVDAESHLVVEYVVHDDHADVLLAGCEANLVQAVEVDDDGVWVGLHVLVVGEEELLEEVLFGVRYGLDDVPVVPGEVEEAAALPFSEFLQHPTAFHVCHVFDLEGFLVRLG